MATLAYSTPTGDAVKDTMFGVKFERNDDWPANENRYNTTIDYLGATGIRIGATEYFDPTATNDQNPLITMAEALTWANAHNQNVVMTIPTKDLFTTPVNPNSYVARAIDTAKVAEVKAFVKKLLTVGDTGPDALPDAPIDAIELGNEYWGADITTEEYGKLVNVLSVAVQQAMDELGIPAASQPKSLCKWAANMHGSSMTQMPLMPTWALMSRSKWRMPRSSRRFQQGRGMRSMAWWNTITIILKEILSELREPLCAT